ncbi:MAG: hypothetical protein ACRDRI_21965 [Pseudonocardiaceae bacterium]
MTNDPIPPSQANRLVLLLDTLTGVTLSDAEGASLTWLAGFERCTVEKRRRRDHPRPQAAPAPRSLSLPPCRGSRPKVAPWGIGGRFRQGEGGSWTLRMRGRSVRVLG